MIPKTLEEIITPSLIIDYDILMDNISKMVNFVKENHINIRPHFKTHKCVDIAKLQVKYGAIGITCATIDEAEILCKNGIKNILIANEIVDEGKIRRLINIVKKDNNVIVTVDNEQNLRKLSCFAKRYNKCINVVVEVDIGLNRCGREAGYDTLKFVKEVLRHKNIKFKGLLGYEGHTVFIENRKERVKECLKSLEKIISTKSLLEKNGIYSEIVSTGGTGTYDITGGYSGITEIQPGSYVFMDVKYKRVIKDFKNSLFVYTTVIDKKSDYCIIDAGYKAYSTEFGIPELIGKKAKIIKIYEEHSKVKNLDSKFKLGEKLLLLPTHCCTTVNLHNKFYVVQNDKLKHIWKICRERI
jgi:D-serine deaminase-like pyridoxal phosphate-dependent protein